MNAQESVTTYDKVIALGCWIFPLLALLLLFVRSTPLFVRRHAQWALLLPVLLVFTLTPAMAAIEALSDVVFVSTPVEVAIGVYGFLMLVNLLALFRGRGPWNRPLPA